MLRSHRFPAPTPRRSLNMQWPRHTPQLSKSSTIRGTTVGMIAITGAITTDIIVGAKSSTRHSRASRPAVTPWSMRPSRTSTPAVAATMSWRRLWTSGCRAEAPANKIAEKHERVAFERPAFFSLSRQRRRGDPLPLGPVLDGERNRRWRGMTDLDIMSTNYGASNALAGPAITVLIWG